MMIEELASKLASQSKTISSRKHHMMIKELASFTIKNKQLKKRPHDDRGAR